MSGAALFKTPLVPGGLSHRRFTFNLEDSDTNRPSRILASVNISRDFELSACGHFELQTLFCQSHP
jgi:hypothetical protein